MEKINWVRSNNLNDLYALALAQILSKDSIAADSTLTKLTKLDPNNQYLFLAKGIVELYCFKPKYALLSFENSLSLSLVDDPSLIKVTNSLINVSKALTFQFF